MSVFDDILKEVKPLRQPGPSNIFEQEYSNMSTTNVFESLLTETPPEPSYLKVSARSFARTTEQLVGSVIGGGLQWTGEALESIIPDEADIFDKAASKLAEKGGQFRKFMIRQSLKGMEAPDPRIWQGTFMQNPSWKRAVGLVTGALPTLMSAYAAGHATLQATGNPVAAARAGGALIGLMVAPETYVEAREAGKGVLWSSTMGVARGVGEAVLETIPLKYFLSPSKMPTKLARRAIRAGKGIKFVDVVPRLAKAKAVASRVFTGAAIEGTEEVLQEIWSNAVAKVGYDKTRNLMTGVIESLIAGAGSGGALGAFTAGITQRIDNLASEVGWTDKEWGLVTRDIAEQIKQNKGSVENKFKSLGAAARGFDYDNFLEDIKNAADIPALDAFADIIDEGDFTQAQIRKLNRAVQSKRRQLKGPGERIKKKSFKAFKKDREGLSKEFNMRAWRKSFDKAWSVEGVNSLMEKAETFRQQYPDQVAELTDIANEKLDSIEALRISGKQVAREATQEDRKQLGYFLRNRGLKPSYRDPQGKIRYTRKPGWKRVEEDAFITSKSLPIKKGDFTWDELAQELILSKLGHLFNYSEDAKGFPGDQLRTYVKDNLGKGDFITEKQQTKEVAKKRVKGIREERRQAKLQAQQQLAQEKRNFTLQLNSFRKILRQLQADATPENRALIANEMEGLRELYRKERPPWQKRMIKEVVDEYETVHKNLRQAFTREGERINSLLPAMLGTMKESSINKANLPKWIKTPLQQIAQFYHYRSLRAARLFEMLDGYKHGENSKMYDWVNTSRSNMLKDFNFSLEGLITGIEEAGVNLHTWYQPSITLSNVRINQVDAEMRGQIAIENGIKDRQVALKIIDSSKGDIILDRDMKVWLYAALQDTGARAHLLEHGFLLDGDMIQLDQSHVEAIQNSITPEEMQVYELIRDWFNRRYELLAPVYMDIKGRPLGFVDSYLPIRIDNNLLIPEALGLDEALMPKDLEADLRQHELTIEEPQFTRKRTGANLPLKGGLLTTVLWYLGKSSHFMHMSGTVNDVEKIIRNHNYKRMVLRTRGRGMYGNLTKWVRDVKTYDRQSIFDPVADVAKIFRRNTGVAVLGLNLISSLRQSLSTFNAIAEVGGPSPIMSGWHQVMFNYKDVKEFVHSRSPQVRYRMVERDIEEIIRSKGAREVFGRESRLSEKAMTLIRGMDRWTVLAVWKGAYDYALGKTGNEKESIRRADEVVRKTQPMADLKDLPMFFRGGELTRMFTMFQNQINNNYNYWTQDILGKALAGEIETKDVATRILWSYVIPALIMGLINRGGPPEDLDDLAKDMITYPIAGLVFIGGIVNGAIKGYSESLPLPAQQVQAMLKALQSKDPRNAMWYSSRAMARLLGVPGVAQAERSFKGARDLMAGHTEDVRRLIWSEWQLRGGKKPTKSRATRRRRRRR